MLEGMGFMAEVNIDENSPTSPGTAIAWRKSFAHVEVFTVVKCRCQIIQVGPISVVNVYAPSGSSKRRERNSFFCKDVFRALSIIPKSSFILDFVGSG